MCRGDITQLVCGHTLAHITRCPHTETYARCVIAWERHNLCDTCAPCDPDVRRHQLSAEYEARHTAITGQMLAAQRRDDKSTVAELGRLATRLLARYQESIREVLELEKKVGLVVSE